MVVSDRIVFHHCANCHGWFQKMKDSQVCCSSKCEARYYANLRKVSLTEKKQEPREQTKAEKIMEEMHSYGR